MFTTESVENILPPKSPPPPSTDQYCCCCFKYEHCIAFLAVIGFFTQVGVACVVITYLAIGFGFDTDDLQKKAVGYSVIVLFSLLVTALSEIVLIRAVNKRLHRYIQHWMVFTLLIFTISIIMAIVTGFTLNEFERAFWIIGAFVLLVIRLPFQMYLVDKFAHANIFHQEMHLYD